MATNGNAHEDHPTSSQSSEIGGNKASSGELSKEEVGWYFVEQYYKTLNKSPEKLHVSPSPCPCAWADKWLTAPPALLQQEFTIPRGQGRRVDSGFHR
jgi:hypothetical protein